MLEASLANTAGMEIRAGHSADQSPSYYLGIGHRLLLLLLGDWEYNQYILLTAYGDIDRMYQIKYFGVLIGAHTNALSATSHAAGNFFTILGDVGCFRG